MVVFGGAMASNALASFDLMMMPGADGRVYRYDPVNNIQLGSFSTGLSNRYLTNDNSGNLYVGTSGSANTRVYTWGNGEITGGYLTTSQRVATNFYNGHLYVQTTNSLRRYDPVSGALLSTINLPTGVTWQTSAMGRGYLHVVGVNTSNLLSVVSVNLANMTVGTVATSSATVNSGAVLGKAAVAYNDGGEVARLGFAADLFGGMFFYNALLDYASGQHTGGAFSSSFIGGAGGFDNGAIVPTTMSGHTGFWLYGADDTNPTTTARVMKFDLVSFALQSSNVSFAAPGGGFAMSGNDWHSTNVVAPEPGTFLALGAGALALLRRRKRAA